MKPLRPYSCKLKLKQQVELFIKMRKARFNLKECARELNISQHSIYKLKKFVDKTNDKVKIGFSCESVHKYTVKKSGFVNATDCLPNIWKGKRFHLAFGVLFRPMVGFEFENRLAGADYRRCGLPDCLSFCNSYLLKAGLARIEHTEDFNLLCVHNCASLGDNKGKF